MPTFAATARRCWGLLDPALKTIVHIPSVNSRESQQGDTVTFEDRDGRGITGVVVRTNQRTATIGTGTANGRTWRVPFHMQRHVLDI